MTGPLITADLVEQCARAAYAAIMADAHPSRATRDELGEWRRRIHRIQARAVLTEALWPPVPPVSFSTKGKSWS